MAQQTAVDTLMENIFGKDFRRTVSDECLNFYQISVGMEKEQIMKAFSDGQELPINNPLLPYYSSMEYYNDTFNK